MDVNLLRQLAKLIARSNRQLARLIARSNRQLARLIVLINLIYFPCYRD